MELKFLMDAGKISAEYARKASCGKFKYYLSGKNMIQDTYAFIQERNVLY